MLVRRTVKRGFTLVEILIVVVILGILAAIVVPQFTNAANEARGGNTATQVSTIENQIELWAARHNGQYPDLVGDGWGDADTPGTMLGDAYLKTIPINPFTGTSTVEASDDPTADALGAAEEGGTAWFYNADTGEIQAANLDEAEDEGGGGG
jgi:general secretion pathway protein G